MLRRLFWVLLGAALAGWLLRRLGLLGRGGDVGENLRELAAAVREGMAEREHELRVALGVDAGAMDPERARDLLENPMTEHDR